MVDLSSLPGFVQRIRRGSRDQSRKPAPSNVVSAMSGREVLRRTFGEVMAFMYLLKTAFKLAVDPKMKTKTSLLQFVLSFVIGAIHEAITNDGTSCEDVVEKCLGTGNFTALRGKVAIITGASNGLGLENARCLMKYGCHVVWAVRNLEKAQRALASLEEAEGKYSGQATMLKVELSDLQSVKEFATAFLDLGLPLNYLILNAGIMAPLEWTPSAQGYESMFATNNLSHFLMTELLLEKLKSTAKSGEARVVILSSMAGTFCSDMDLSKVPVPKEFYNELSDYSVTKACDAFHAKQLQRELDGTNVWVTAVHPGIVHTALGTGNDGVTNLFYGSLLMSWARQGVASGAATTVHCALSDTIPQQIREGQFYYYNRAPQKPMGIMGSRDDLCQPLRAKQLELVQPFL